jgi:hypothetical protein
MKAIIEFDLIEEREQFDLALKAPCLLAAQESIFENLRQKLKYNYSSYNENELSLLEDLRNEFFKIVKEYNVDDL